MAAPRWPSASGRRAWRPGRSRGAPGWAARHPPGRRAGPRPGTARRVGRAGPGVAAEGGVAGSNRRCRVTGSCWPFKRPPLPGRSTLPGACGDVAGGWPRWAAPPPAARTCCRLRRAPNDTPPGCAPWLCMWGRPPCRCCKATRARQSEDSATQWSHTRSQRPKLEPMVLASYRGGCGDARAGSQAADVRVRFVLSCRRRAPALPPTAAAQMHHLSDLFSDPCLLTARYCCKTLVRDATAGCPCKPMPPLPRAACPLLVGW